MYWQKLTFVIVLHTLNVVYYFYLLSDSKGSGDMNGNSQLFTGYLDGNKNRFLIPVYQRKYEWKTENCLQLYKDLCKLAKEKDQNHFFGSIVSNIIPKNGFFEHHIIDGQQRITTITLLFLAMHNLLEEKRLISENENLKEEILETYLILKFKKGEDRYRLVPVAADRDAFHKLFGDSSDYDESSKLTINYHFFYNLLLREEVSIDDLYDAINRLQIINITLEHGDNAQLIFESLNSTGLALEEGDKIRNYVLMGLDPDEQEEFFKEYWEKIEILTQNKVSDFIRDYLSIKQQSTPNINNVYHVFKQYTLESQLTIREVLTDLLKYARFFGKLMTCKSELGNKFLDDCLYRLKRLDVTVARPFFMEVLRLNHDNRIDTEDVLNVFLATENYLFRRNICDVPTNALNKIFVTINKEVIRYDNTTHNYYEKFLYALESKRESSRFPDDEEFAEALANKQVYNMRGKYKTYLFERFENYGTVETKEVYNLLDNNTYTIEHIMPQHLTSDWQDALGSNYQEIHETWLHRLANLTLTGYNPNLSNKLFIEKRDASVGGYKNSGLRMNQKIAQLDKWGVKELTERNEEMVEKALMIWEYPETSFKPVEKEFDSCTLDDEDIDLTGRDIVKYSYKNAEQPVTSWIEMMEQVVSSLHQQDKSVLASIAYGSEGSSEVGNYFSKNPDVLRSPIKIDDSIFMEKNTSTLYKMIILRKLFVLYGRDPLDLVFYLKDQEKEKESEAERYELRKRYWTYALPQIQHSNIIRGTFSGCGPVKSNTISGSFGISGCYISCVANQENARIDFCIGKNKAELNKSAFDYLYSFRHEIEPIVGTELKWNRADEYKMSWLSYELDNVKLENENDWPRMAKFHSESSCKILNAVLPRLREWNINNSADPDSERRWDNRRVIQEISKEWTYNNDYIIEDLDNCTVTYIRFKTDYMSKLFPDSEELSEWGTPNHYYYEIVNKDGENLYVQLAMNSYNMPEEQKKLTDIIHHEVKGIKGRMEWSYKWPFNTDKFSLKGKINKEDITVILDKCFKQITDFENGVKSKESILLGLAEQSNG